MWPGPCLALFCPNLLSFLWSFSGHSVLVLLEMQGGSARSLCWAVAADCSLTSLKEAGQPFELPEWRQESGAGGCCICRRASWGRRRGLAGQGGSLQVEEASAHPRSQE